jgi:hypothetical protein
VSGIEKIPLMIPEEWSAAWYRQHVAEVLSKLDTRNSIGNGILVTSDGNSVATLSATDAIEQAINAHKAETDPHEDLIDDLTEVTAVAEADYVLVSQSGANKKATVNQLAAAVFGDDWTDLVIPAVGINPAGAAAPPSLNNATGCLEFSASADNVIIITWQLPHGWSGETDPTKAVVVPHLHVRHLTSTTAPNNVSRWRLEYDVADPFGNFTNAYGTFTSMATVSVTNPANTALCGLVDLGDLDLAGYGASCILHCKISRLASSDAADNDSSVIALYSADLHFQTRTAGTENEIPS